MALPIFLINFKLQFLVSVTGHCSYPANAAQAAEPPAATLTAGPVGTKVAESREQPTARISPWQ